MTHNGSFCIMIFGDKERERESGNSMVCVFERGFGGREMYELKDIGRDKVRCLRDSVLGVCDMMNMRCGGPRELQCSFRLILSIGG